MREKQNFFSPFEDVGNIDYLKQESLLPVWFCGLLLYLSVNRGLRKTTVVSFHLELLVRGSSELLTKSREFLNLGMLLETMYPNK